ncbi:uncharacterized protein LOC142980708 isoform X2 [Anticarsia gemmatalis]|uniref:uncharacterized protein LOC142980708 isoform X2 n=1 Tax=Anticarsia gemmatalis TaxID=129554 RepID=UPI003F75F741
MLPIYFTLVYVVLNSDALSIGVVRAQNVTKREANVEDLFPDWVPFKNKHGEQLGEFVQVAKPKPKKRLAPPVNFILRAVAEPEGEEYYDKGQGEGDGEEYFEKKEWSDTNRPAAEPEEKVKVQNHTDISDIDGVVNIITRRPNPVVEALKKAKQNAEQKKDEDRSEEEEQEAKPEPKKEEKEKAARPTVAPVTPAPEKSPKYEEEADYEEEGTVKHKPDPSDDEQSENEAKKASILDSVDELKERHAEEQRVINEKLKEDVITQEEQERDRLNGQPINEHLDKYADHKPIIQKPRVPDYEEYDYKDINKEDKYLATPERTKPTTTRLPQRTKKQKGKKQVETGKLSVFKNPQLYIVYDDELEETTTMKPRAKPKPKTSKLKKVKENKYSAKYVVKPTSAEATERISMVPEENDIKEGEPTLFFPKKRKNKKRKKTRPTAPIDSLVAETVSAQRAKEKAIEPSALDSIVTDTTEAVPSAADAVSANTDSVTDAVVASTEHKAAPKHDNYHREKGGGKEYSSSHEEEHGEEGKKAYEGVHKESKSAKGYHEKENHLGKYDDHGGIDKHHEEEAGHYGAHHHEEHGKKHAKYEESGKHSKGHSTKGSHDIHKKEEYEKKVEFFEEDGDSSEEEKHGGYDHEHGHSKGGHFKQGNLKAGHEEHHRGDSGHFAKGGHLHMSRGHKSAGGHDGHGKNAQAHQAKGGHAGGKKWIYHHGSPAKTAALVRIDRRADTFQPSPQYYG